MMKFMKLFLLMLCLPLSVAHAQDATLSTLRIGEFKHGMTLSEVQALTEKPLRNGKDEYGNDIKVATYQGERITLSGLPLVESGATDESKVYGLSTKSSKFRTKNGLGVGSTKDELFDAYKNYPSFSVGRVWDNKTQKTSTTDTYFELEDGDSGTRLQFEMRNNVVIEVSVYMDEGC